MTEMSLDKNVPRREITLHEAFVVWLRIALLSFGGPAGQIALMHRVLVDERKWISDARFLHALNFCMLLPGPEAQQLATYIGWLMHGVRGGVVAGTMFVLPGFVIIMALSIVYALYGALDVVSGLFFGLKAAVLAVVIEALLRIGKRALKTRALYGLAAVAFIAIFGFHVPFPVIIAAAGVFGLIAVRIWPNWLGLQLVADEQSSRAVDMAAAKSQGAPTIKRGLQVIAVCGALWIAPIVLLVILFGRNSVYPGIAAFFSEMAVVTFGGAYAVLAYVAQAAVNDLRWLNPGEMLDGLALAETTPGPLILVLTFVGFLAGFRDPGGISPLAGGLIGGTLTTWVTFVPCFLWVLLGAPYIERLRSNRALSGALAAITAAVVGVILNLSVWFALHVLFRNVGELNLGWLRPAWPELSSLDWKAALLSAFAMLAMFRWHFGMLPTLAICGAAGLALKFAV
ncbi:MAG: chromate efflux transporter [Pseudomonadota bacterium]